MAMLSKNQRRGVFLVGIAYFSAIASSQAVPTYDYGSIVFVQTTKQDGQAHVAKASYFWDGDKYIVQRQVQPQAKGVLAMARVQTPQGAYEVIDDGAGAKVVNFGGPPFQDDDPFLTVCPGPSLPLGVMPKVVKPLQTPNMYAIGSVSYRVSPGADYWPSKVDRLSSEGEVRATYTYEGKLKNSAGGFLPASVVYEISKAGMSYSREFKFESASLGAKPDLTEYLTNWNQPGFSIADRRVTPEVVWTSEELTKLNGGNPKITPDQLLKWSKGRSEFFDRSLKQGEKALADKSGKQDSVLYIGIVFGILIAATFIVPAVLRRRRSR